MNETLEVSDAWSDAWNSIWVPTVTYTIADVLIYIHLRLFLHGRCVPCEKKKNCVKYKEQRP